MATSPSSSRFSFTLTKVHSPRLGTILLRRSDASFNAQTHQLPTPTFLTTTSRGVVPHLSKDNQRLTSSIRWVNISFETFMEHNPPVPTLYPGKDPLHQFLGFTPGRQIVSMSARDPDDGREMPPNGKTSLSVWTLRGVRKLSPTEWRSYALACQPDLVIAMSDTPFTDPPYSQKRLTKSIERSAAWLASLIRPISAADNVSSSVAHLNAPQSSSGAHLHHPTVLVHMSGGSSIPARRAFSSSLMEPLYGPEANLLSPLKSLDEGVAGYTFDLKPLRQAIEAAERKDNGAKTVGILPPTNGIGTDGAVLEDSDPDLVLPAHTDSIVPLLRASLAKLPEEKVRVLNSTEGPHEILKYITEVGVDVFDGGWAQRAADNGIGLDFTFPVREAKTGDELKRDIAHDFYDVKYVFDFGTISDCFRGAFVGSMDGKVQDERPICPCAACSPLTPQHQISHGVDTPEYTRSNPIPGDGRAQPHHTRAYIHHLLHTHEMSAHTLLVMHNLAVLSHFFEGIRGVIESLSSGQRPEGGWAEEVQKFHDTYDMGRGLFVQARKRWREVDLARGKGRLAREKEKEVQPESIEIDSV